MKNVKGVFDDTFSKNVDDHFGVTRRSSPFSSYLRFSLDENGTADELSNEETPSSEQPKAATVDSIADGDTLRRRYKQATVYKAQGLLSHFDSLPFERQVAVCELMIFRFTAKNGTPVYFYYNGKHVNSLEMRGGVNKEQEAQIYNLLVNLYR
ncbi:MAG: hypothetical protein IJY04_03760 [Clostridia bacterium]|nr:hypothetical protein [Clostridia bacterium]